MSAPPLGRKPLPRIVAPSSNTLILHEWIGVTVPMCPPVETSPNGGHSPRKQAKAKATYKRETFLETTSVINATPRKTGQTPFPLATRLAVSITVGWAKGRSKGGAVDDDNMHTMLKSAIDGFAQAIGVDDSWFDLAPIEQVRDQDGVGWTRIVAWPRIIEPEDTA